MQALAEDAQRPHSPPPPGPAARFCCCRGGLAEAGMSLQAGGGGARANPCHWCCARALSCVGRAPANPSGHLGVLLVSPQNKTPGSCCCPCSWFGRGLGPPLGAAEAGRLSSLTKPFLRCPIEMPGVGRAPQPAPTFRISPPAPRLGPYGLGEPWSGGAAAELPARLLSSPESQSLGTGSVPASSSSSSSLPCTSLLPKKTAAESSLHKRKKRALGMMRNMFRGEPRAARHAKRNSGA